MEDESICIVCDAYKSFTDDYILQLVSMGSELSIQKKYKVVVICIGNVDEQDINLLYGYGADYVYFCNPKVLVHNTEIVVIVENMLGTLKNIKLVMFPSTIWGEYVAASISNHLDVGLTADCIDVFIENNKFVYARTALNSSIVANIVTKDCKFGICTIKKNVFGKKPYDRNRTGTKKMFEYTYSKNNFNEVKVLEKVFCNQFDYNLGSSKIVFGVGRGIIQSKSLALLKKVAEKYGASVAGTRPVIECGILDESQQVGQSGKSINPNIYIAFGISGASQHMIGVKNAKTIVAVNTDDNANIFEYVDYKIVADANVILKQMLEL